MVQRNKTALIPASGKMDMNMNKVAVSLDKSEAVGGDAWCVREGEEAGEHTHLLDPSRLAALRSVGLLKLF